jgi:hypothetical protein
MHFYAAQARNLVDKTHQRVRLVPQAHAAGRRAEAGRERSPAFYANNGANQADFLIAMKSFDVDVKAAARPST